MDALLRDSERRGAQGDLVARAALLQGKLRAGTLTQEGLALIAYCGDRAATSMIAYAPGTGCGQLAPEGRVRDAGVPGAGLRLACQWHEPRESYLHGYAYHNVYTWADVYSPGHRPFGAGMSWPEGLSSWLAGLREWGLYESTTNLLMGRLGLLTRAPLEIDAPSPTLATRLLWRMQHAGFTRADEDRVEAEIRRELMETALGKWYLGVSCPSL